MIVTILILEQAQMWVRNDLIIVQSSISKQKYKLILIQTKIIQVLDLDREFKLI